MQKELSIKLTDLKDFIITNEKMETDVPGLYVIGDLREKEMRQIVTAMGDGAQATKEVSNYLNFLA